MIKSESRKLEAACRGAVIAMLLMLVMIGGCRSSAPLDAPLVAKVVRYSESAAEDFAEGETESAIETFRKAIHRSWATDDPYHAGTNAYNLAAVLFDRGDHASAIDWLVDARAELARAGASPGYTYLLEAKIAQKEGRFDDARRMISLADCAPPPCHDDGDDGKCRCDPCREPALACVPCLGNKLENKKAAGQCRADYQAQVHLAQARLAADQYDVSLASKQLACARELAKDVCSDDLRAEIEHAAAMIDLAQGRYLQTAAHLDREALLLRQAGNYRKIPQVLKLSAAAYQQAARFDLAADRLCRAARIWFARGEFGKSWEILQQALIGSEPETNPFNHVRWRLTAREIETAATHDDGQATDSADQPVGDSALPASVP